MKKIFTAVLFATLATSFAACSDSDDDTVACFEPKAVTMLKDYNALGTAATDLNKMEDKTAAAYISACETFITNIDNTSKKYKDLSADSLKDDWDNFKNTNWACKVTHILNSTIASFSVADASTSIKNQATACGGVAFGGAAEGAEKASAAVTSLDGWSGILQTAADYTAQEAAKDNN